jgi:hypothetical protein
MNTSKLIILTFVVTALWDVILRQLSLNVDYLPKNFDVSTPFIRFLKPYFEQHTLLAAALIAGFVGATTQPIILMFMSFPEKITNWIYVLAFLAVTFVVSALFGFVMKWSGLFPYLERYYYNKLGVRRSMYYDGVSGLIVQVTLLVFFAINKCVRLINMKSC